MKLQELFIGALTLRTETFVQLRARSDTFLRGFMVLFVTALVVGAFAATQTLVQQWTAPSKQVVLAEIKSGMESTGAIPPEILPLAENYAFNVASMIYEITQLPPQIGAWAKPLADGFNWLGTLLSWSFSWGYAGWMLFGGLLFGSVAMALGGRGDLNKMLGLTALAAAPQILNAIPALLSIIATITGLAALTGLNDIFGFVIVIWSAIIYIKAMAIAQQISIARALAAIVLGYVVLAGLFAAFIVLIGVMITLMK